MSSVCRTIADVRAVALIDARQDPPLSQEQADLVAALLASSMPAANAA